MRRRGGKRLTEAKLKSITRMLYVTAQVCAIVWVFISYGIAVYSTIVLGQVYTMTELSEPAITVIIGALIAKTVGNIFEHNDGAIFGTSKDTTTEESTDMTGGSLG